MPDDPIAAAGRPITLTLFPLDDCAPCAVVKQALDHPDFARYACEVRQLHIDEIRELRREIGRLSFPILVAEAGGKIVSRRLGARSADPNAERSDLLAWLALVERRLSIDTEAGPAPAAG